ncbi:MAG: hypothetical protein J7479_17665, partial [Roseiflexus sp.]|nr:hypothetical protein [Roseiflexus sp.]MBO9384145.1 hypothetical protein [Roseiflexus sp.]
PHASPRSVTIRFWILCALGVSAVRFCSKVIDEKSSFDNWRLPFCVHPHHECTAKPGEMMRAFHRTAACYNAL